MPERPSRRAREVQATPAAATGAPAYRSAGVSMDTLVSLEVLTSEPEVEVRAALERALAWFRVVERTCSRFNPASELRRLLAAVGTPVEASPLLFEATQFALALAELTDGAFDPTVGHLMERKGFDRNYVSGERVASAIAPTGQVSYRDVRLDPQRRTIELRQPLVLDLGAVAKGLAIDLAARELASFPDVCVDAGGDLLARGRNSHGQPWRVGVQDPRDPDALVYLLDVSGQAVCTSGDYERRTRDGDGHHLIDPRSGQSARTLASVTVIAATAMAADGLATAAFVLGPRRGLRLLEQEGVEGVLVTPDGAVRTTSGLRSPAR